MTMSPRLRKTVLTVHVATSVGWLGAVAAYLALDVTATLGDDAAVVRGSYLAMGVLVSYVIVPLALVTVLIGIVNALGTPWGLLRHYWVLVKLLLTIAATAVLLIEAPAVGHLAATAADASDPAALPGTLLHSVGGTVVLALILVISVFKPPGLTRYGWRQRRGTAARQRADRTPHLDSGGLGPAAGAGPLSTRAGSAQWS